MYMRLPDDVTSRYRPASDADMRARSYGRLKSATIGAATDAQWVAGSFDDQTIFGPKCDFQCACGKYDGRHHEGMICDVCRVKVTSAESRRSRCAHINVSAPIAHPWDDRASLLHVIPVLPVVFVEAPAGAELLNAYDRVLRGTDASAISDGLAALLDALAPLLIAAHRWDLRERVLIAHGMALKHATT